MNDLTLFNQPKPETISVQTLVEHVLLRASQQNVKLVKFSASSVSKWATANLQNEVWQKHGMPHVKKQLTQQGCTLIAMTLPPSILSLVNQDILVLFQGQSEVQQMVNSTCLPVTEKRGGPFLGRRHDPAGCTPFHFPNGTRGVSSSYLREIIFNLSKLDHSVVPVKHSTLMAAIRLEYKFILDSHSEGLASHSYYGIEESTMTSKKGEVEPHIWMSQDLCLLMATKCSVQIHSRVIDDLNRMHHILQTYTEGSMYPPVLHAFLPGTTAEARREENVVEVLTGEAEGYFPVYKVKQLWAEQMDCPEEDFDKSHRPMLYHSNLRGLLDHFNIPMKFAPSGMGGTFNLYPVNVLQEVFNDVDLSSLKPK